jgi:hypothetical protein
MRRARIAPAALCVGAIFLAGCGGGTDRDFVAEANAVCAKAGREGESAKPPKTQAELVTFFDSALGLGNRELASLRALQPPASKAVAYQRWLGSLDQTMSLLRRADGAAKAGDVAQVRSIIRDGNGRAKRNVAAAEAVGLLTCAKVSS